MNSPVCRTGFGDFILNRSAHVLSGDSCFLATDLFLFWNGQAKSKEANGKEELPHPNRGECSKQRSKEQQDLSRQSPGEQRPTASHAWLLPGNLSINSLPQQKWLKVSVKSNFKRNKGEMPLKNPNFFHSVFSSDTLPYTNTSAIIALLSFLLLVHSL